MHQGAIWHLRDGLSPKNSLSHLTCSTQYRFSNLSSFYGFHFQIQRILIFLRELSSSTVRHSLLEFLLVGPGFHLSKSHHELWGDLLCLMFGYPFDLVNYELVIYLLS